MPDQIHLTVATVVEREGRFLMVVEESVGQMVINQPAGHVEPGEDIMAAALRETLEETAWTVSLQGFLGVYTYKAPQNQATYYRLAFFARPIEHLQNLPLDSDIDHTAWMTIAELRNSAIPLRSPLVLQCIEDYLSGKIYPLELIRGLPITEGIG